MFKLFKLIKLNNYHHIFLKLILFNFDEYLEI